MIWIAIYLLIGAVMTAYLYARTPGAELRQQHLITLVGSFVVMTLSWPWLLGLACWRARLPDQGGRCER
jgi:hypothetical protein